MAIKALEQEPCEDMERKIEKEYLFESLCEDLKKLQAEYENLRKALEQESVLDKINKMKSEIADSLEFWDYSPNNNPLARDMLETITNFWGEVSE